MKNKIIKVIVITILLSCLITLSGCTSGIKVSVSKTGNSNNEQVVIGKPDTSVKEIDFTKDKEKLLNDISVLSDRILKTTSDKSIRAVLEDYGKTNSTSISAVYFADNRGGFHVFPNLQLPEGYDAKTRPWYIQAIQNKVYVTKYQDAASGKFILTVAEPVSKNNENMGVIGIDKFIGE